MCNWTSQKPLFVVFSQWNVWSVQWSLYLSPGEVGFHCTRPLAVALAPTRQLSLNVLSPDLPSLGKDNQLRTKVTLTKGSARQLTSSAQCDFFFTLLVSSLR